MYICKIGDVIISSYRPLTKILEYRLNVYKNISKGPIYIMEPRIKITARARIGNTLSFIAMATSR